MVIAVFVVAHGGGVHYRSHDFGGDDGSACALFSGFVAGDRASRGLQNRETLACVATGHAHDIGDGFVRGFDLALETAVISQRALHQFGELIRLQ